MKYMIKEAFIAANPFHRHNQWERGVAAKAVNISTSAVVGAGLGAIAGGAIGLGAAAIALATKKPISAKNWGAQLIRPIKDLSTQTPYFTKGVQIGVGVGATSSIIKSIKKNERR